MTDSAATALVLLSTTGLGVALYSVRRNQRSAERIEAGQCVRCGAPTSEPVELVSDLSQSGPPLLMCERCAARTLRRERTILYGAAIGGGAIVLFLTMTLVALPGGWKDRLWFVGPLGVFGMLGRIFYRGRLTRQARPVGRGDAQ